MPPKVRAQIAEMGAHLNPKLIRRTVALMRPLLADRTGLSFSRDIAYGFDPLQKLDIYAPQENTGRRAPIVIFVHGVAFSRGDKRSGENVAAYFARHGMLGVTMNYRLAPAVTWPAQSLDVGAAVAWLNANARHYGGTRDRSS
jgi:arylformamidase